MAEARVALFSALEINTNCPGGTRRLNSCIHSAKTVIREKTPEPLRNTLTRVLDDMTACLVAKTPGSWRPHVVYCLELLLQGCVEGPLKERMHDRMKLDQAKQRLRIKEDKVSSIRRDWSGGSQKRSVLKQLLKHRDKNTSTHLTVRSPAVCTATESTASHKKNNVESTSAASAVASNVDYISPVLHDVMSCAWPGVGQGSPKQHHYIAVANAIGWDPSIRPMQKDMAQELRKRYKFAVLHCHPDKCSDPRAAQAFQRIQATYEELSRGC